MVVGQLSIVSLSAFLAAQQLLQELLRLKSTSTTSLSDATTQMSSPMYSGFCSAMPGFHQRGGCLLSTLAS
eukprot:994322-Amphidinium_carterae.1